MKSAVWFVLLADLGWGPAAAPAADPLRLGAHAAIYARDGSLMPFVRSIKAMVDAIGIDHVGIGTDTDLLSSRVGGGTNSAWPELTKKFFPIVVEEMLRQGFTPREVSKVAGGNYCRIFGRVTGHA